MRFAAALVISASALSVFGSITVRPARTSFNPSLHQSLAYTITTDAPGNLTVDVVDRDLYATKNLVHHKRVAAGTTTLTWDGTDADGRPVADEAWSLRVELKTASGVETYFPGAKRSEMLTIKADMYDSWTGVLRYTLPVASRVHLEAGISDPSSASPTAGAVMKTIVNRQPRPAGAVVEQWTGMDESGTVYVPALKNFVVAIAATPLPESSVITYGNRSRTFLDTALARTGEPLAKIAVHDHHQGLTALDDVAPQLVAKPASARWTAESKTWIASSPNFRLSIAPTGATADHFVQQPARLYVYVDEKCVLQKAAGDRTLSIPLPDDHKPHIVAVNWASAYGPVAATALRVQIE